jgi:hypothetical protein
LELSGELNLFQVEDQMTTTLILRKVAFSSRIRWIPHLAASRNPIKDVPDAQTWEWR